MAGAAFPNSSRKVIYQLSYALRLRCRSWRSLSDRAILSKTRGGRIVSKNLGILLWRGSRIRNLTKILIFCSETNSTRNSNQTKECPHSKSSTRSKAGLQPNLKLVSTSIVRPVSNMFLPISKKITTWRWFQEKIQRAGREIPCRQNWALAIVEDSS